MGFYFCHWTTRVSAQMGTLLFFTLWVMFHVWLGPCLFTHLLVSPVAGMSIARKTPLLPLGRCVPGLSYQKQLKCWVGFLRCLGLHSVHPR